MNYNDYLDLDNVLNSQKLLTQEHSELLFIVAHQSSELWFKVLIHELNVPTDVNLKRIIKIFNHLNTLWDIIATITPDDYDAFRGSLGSASGKQSSQYIEVERLLKNLPSKCCPNTSLFPREVLLDVENAFKKWQYTHMKTVERIIGNKPGTGGTSGVQYLKLAVDKELWK
jgi:tryptophan 2,3-dioxygenase